MLFQAHQYFSDANEAEAFMKEKESLAGNTDYGKDEDSAEALLKRHEAFISDLEAFKNTIEGLKEQATNCRQQETPIGKLRFIFFTFQLKKKKNFHQFNDFFQHFLVLRNCFTI